MLAGDYLCYDHLAKDRGLDPACRLCQPLLPHPAPAEDMIHLLTVCRATADTRSRIIPDLLNCIVRHFPNNNLLSNLSHNHLSQFILDPTSLNLPLNIRIQPCHPDLCHVMTTCRNLCFALHRDRIRQLKHMVD